MDFELILNLLGFTRYGLSVILTNHKVEISLDKSEETYREIGNWIKNNIIGLWDYQYGLRKTSYPLMYDDTIIFNFENEIDAMHFSLRWK